ncbi:MAG TPA: hypothetical protein DEP87_00350 [Candidatus Pacebacteria bacterium]|nr:hypothetical protein [Candidatus Paceibacterota bacterium]
MRKFQQFWWGLLIFLGIFGGWGFHATSQVLAADKSYTVGKVNIGAELKTDGSMQVVEQRLYNFSGDYKFAYRDFKLQPNQAKIPGRTESYELKNFEVCEEKNCYRQLRPDQVNWQSPRENPVGTFTVRQLNDQTLRVQWHFSAVSVSKVFTLKYVVVNAATLHGDTTELYWQWIGSDWTVFQENVRVTLGLPMGIPDDQLQAWAHGPLAGVVAIPNPTTVNFYLPRLPSGQFFEGRVVFPKGIIWASAKGTSSLSQIQAQEAKFIAETQAKRLKYEQYFKWLARFLTGLAGVMVLGWIWMMWRFWGGYKDKNFFLLFFWGVVRGAGVEFSYPPREPP